MEKNIEVSLLLDFYGELLNPFAREAIDLYYNEDLSLSEIAAQTGVTRQGVRDRIKRNEQQLFEFERKLGLYRRFNELESGLAEIAKLAHEIFDKTQDENISGLAGDIELLASGLKE